jgi:S1-C subfamily serine protease
MRAGVVLIVLLLSACATAGVHVDQSKLARFQAGRTTVADVIVALGAPTNSTVSSNGTRTLVYVFSQVQTRPETFIPYVGAFVGGADSRSEAVVFRFDGDGRLIDYTASNSGVGVGTGFASGGNGAQVAAAPMQAPQAASPSQTVRVAATSPPIASAARRDLGIRALPVSAAQASSLQLNPPRGFVVLSVAPSGVASVAGIQPGDVILAFNGTPIVTIGDMRKQLATIGPNASVPAEIRRGEQDLTVQLQF